MSDEAAPGRRRTAMLAIVLAGVFMSVLDGVVTTIALPTITKDLGTSVSQSQWVVSIYPIVETALIIVFAKIAERTGLASMFTAGLAVFTVSSALCGLSADLAQLILFRTVQGVGAAMMFGISFAIVFRVFPAGERGRAMGIMGSFVAVAMMGGPPIGGALVGALGWQSIFWINVPIGAAVTLWALRSLKIQEVRSERLQLDLIGSALWCAAIGCLMLAMGLIADDAGVDAASLVLLAIAAAALAGFVVRSRRAAFPLLDLTVMRIKQFSWGSVSMALFFTTGGIASLVAPFFYEGWGYTTMETGIIMAVLPAVMGAMSPWTGKLYDRGVARERLSSYGQAVRAAAFVMLALGFVMQSFALTIAAFAAMGAGSAVFKSPNETEVMSALPREKSGAGSSVTATVRNMSLSLGLSLGTLLMSLLLGGADMLERPFGDLAGATAACMVICAAATAVGAWASWAGNKGTA